MEIVITIEREPDAPSVGIYSEEPGIWIVRDPGTSDRDLLLAYADALESLREEPTPTDSTVEKNAI